MSSRIKRIINMCKNMPETSQTDNATNENIPSTSGMVSKPYLELEAFKSLGSYELSLKQVFLTETSQTDEAPNEDIASTSRMVSKPYLKREPSKSLVSYELSSDEYDSDADPEFVVSETESIRNDSPNIETPKARWKNVNMENWKSRKSKKLRSECKPYPTKTGIKPAKTPKPIDCSKCRFKCTQNFSEDDRYVLCKIYWALEDYKRQKDFIIQHVKTETPKRRKVGAKKQRVIAKQYYLKNANGTFRVCAQYFEKTLCISNGPINTALAYITESGTFSGSDNRGHKTPGNATSEEQINFVKQHIESFPRMLPHYVRKSSSRQYLDPKLSILKMYALYLDFCKEKGIPCVKSPVYRNIFCTQYNLSFFTPKKDQCSTCAKYYSNQTDPVLKQIYEDHIARKEDCYRAKDEDKIRSNEDESFQTITFDLQSVLQIPSTDVGQFYYSRKLCVYNLTVYEGGKQNKAYCFCWNELNGKRGSNEVASVLLRYTNGIPENINHLTMFSDTCGGQNRNQYVAAALLYCVKNHPTIKIIEHKFLESGHSYMECDSMHSAIEHAKKNKSVFLMNDWKEIFRQARSKNKTKKEPYEVVELKYGDIFDFQELARKLIKNRNKDEEGNKVEWIKIKCLKYEKNNPNVIFYKYSHNSDFKKIPVSGRGRPHVQPHILKPAYSQQLQILEQKKRDLIKLCDTGLIPEELQNWYRNLPSRSDPQEEERAPEPEADEDSDFEEN